MTRAGYAIEYDYYPPTQLDATLQVRALPGLYFAGELLDLDGITGGFNFQAAWTTGWIAGRAMAQ